MTGRKNKKEDSDILFKALDSLVPDIVKKIILISIGGVMMTEEAVRKILSEFNLSKDIVSLIITQTNKAKDEVLKTITEEFRQLVLKTDVKSEIENILKDTKVKIQMEIDFESKNKDDVSLSIQPKLKKKNPPFGTGKKEK